MGAGGAYNQNPMMNQQQNLGGGELHPMSA